MGVTETGDGWLNWQQQAQNYLIQKDYDRALSLLDQAISSSYPQGVAAYPEVRSLYWWMGLVLLLQGQEAEAQTTWMIALADGDTAQTEQWTAELIQILYAEAERQTVLSEWAIAWAIRQYIRELNPIDLGNLLHLVVLSTKLENFASDDLKDLGTIELLHQQVVVDSAFLLETLERILDYTLPDPVIFEFIEACIPYIAETTDLLIVLVLAAGKLAHTDLRQDLAIRLLEICIQVAPNHLIVWLELAPIYQNAGQYDKGIAAAKQALTLANNSPDRVFSSHLLLRGLMNAGGYWQEALTALQHHEALLKELISEKPLNLEAAATLRLLVTNYFFSYFRDEPQQNRWLQNQVIEICKTNMQLRYSEQVDRHQRRHQDRQASPKTPTQKKLKIGYISYCLYSHSVGWLARWLMKYHDRDRFELHIYFVNYKEMDDFLQMQYVEMADYAHLMGAYSVEIAEQISQDSIDILIDLDSITLDITSEVIALKPAPVQVTWLGWDASGMSTIDYYIADPYVLPEAAEDYYVEKIWRLPQTYIAVEGFEVGVPTLRRDELGIPSDAVVYLSAQRGYKRHRETAKLQMQILKAVPNSYFLIKGLADQKTIQTFFQELAEEEGIEFDRFRFLPNVASEAIHRANLAIADIVLDTFPYNGATTTLETLWMEIPLVTRVGNQFAARNSYTMLKNAGITEGIAWTDAEYVEWGVRLGKDSTLRQQVSWKLKQSKHTAPLWNAKQFTREMESAYEQMWANYVEASVEIVDQTLNSKL
ncbi:O-linked N-acetylglucosamine transferase, SPINDLY family protein [Phormidesmis priestleyi]